jgi:outer membrane lipoprotein-sorting protein
MFGAVKQSRQARWAVPVGVAVVIGGIMAGSLMTDAQAAPALPVRTPAQLLAEVAGGSAVPPLTGTVVETASLGLPSLPEVGGGSATSPTSLLTGSHTVNVWYASAQRFRLAIPGSLTETDVIRDGSTAWLWESAANTVTKFSVPAHSSQPVPQTAPFTPQQAAQQVLAKVGPTTAVSVQSNVMVAGQAAYELVLAPKDTRSLVGQVRIAVDGANGVPLRLEVLARGATSPAFQVGYTSIQFVTPAPADLTFTPPPGAKVTQADMTGTQQQGATPDASTIGSGWLAVVDLPSSGLTSGSAAGGKGMSASGGPVSVNGGSGDSSALLNTLLSSAAKVSGSWGSGRLLRTSLISVLITDSGRMFAGAVQPSVLYAAAAQAAAGK